MVVKASVLSFTKAVASKCSVVTDIIINMSANSWGNNFTLHVCFCNKVINRFCSQPVTFPLVFLQCHKNITRQFSFTLKKKKEDLLIFSCRERNLIADHV